ncbi:hypothetical protein KC336_g21449 [Hortaea werneckii]|nr:hypothetical protein KC336_g21449 [Hortaea werneckii]
MASTAGLPMNNNSSSSSNNNNNSNINPAGCNRCKMKRQWCIGMNQDNGDPRCQQCRQARVAQCVPGFKQSTGNTTAPNTSTNRNTWRRKMRDAAKAKWQAQNERSQAENANAALHRQIAELQGQSQEQSTIDDARDRDIAELQRSLLKPPPAGQQNLSQLPNPYQHGSMRTPTMGQMPNSYSMTTGQILSSYNSPINQPNASYGEGTQHSQSTRSNPRFQPSRGGVGHGNYGYPGTYGYQGNYGSPPNYGNPTNDGNGSQSNNGNQSNDGGQNSGPGA